MTILSPGSRGGTHTVPTLLLLAAFSGVVAAGPRIVSDPTTTANVTHCAWYLDTAPRELVVAPKDESGKPFCEKDIAGIANGSHTVTAAFVVNDPVWGVLEGPKSDPFAFARPAAPSKPSPLRLAP